MSMMVSFVLSFFPRDVLDEILNLIESVSEDFPSYSYTMAKNSAADAFSILLILDVYMCLMCITYQVALMTHYHTLV